LLAWTVALTMALVLGDLLRWWIATTQGRWRGPWVSGCLLALLGLAGSPQLVLGFLVLGWTYAFLVDRLSAAGPVSLVRMGGSAAALLAVSAGGAHLSASLAPSWLVLLSGVWLGGLPVLGRLLFPRGRAKVLLTTCTSPIPPYAGGHYSLDYYSSRFTNGQGPWGVESETPSLSGHLLARNLKNDAVVLEYPSPEAFREELREGQYEVVGISFYNVARAEVRAMCQVVREILPRATLILGGYGVVCLPEEEQAELSFDGLVDEVCQGEGIAFLRKLLGEDPEVSVDLQLPFQEAYPFGMRTLPRRMAALVVGFGCDKRCGFCGTSAFFSGRNVVLSDAEMIAEQVAKYLVEAPDLVAILIYDEDYLSDRERTLEVARRLQEDPRVDFSRVHFSVFASANSLSKYQPEELAALGISYAWVGAESKFTPLKKRSHESFETLLEDLADQGIGVTLSWILGFDHQTPENIEEDLDWLVDLTGVTAQVSLLTPLPGTPLHRQLKSRDRLISGNWADQHLAAETMLYKNFAPGELAPWVPRSYRTLFERNGPLTLRLAQVWLRGLRTQRAHANPVLAARALELGRQIQEALPALLAMAWVGETPRHRKMARAFLDQAREESFRVGISEIFGAVVVAAVVRSAEFWLKLLGLPSRQPPVRRFLYRGGERLGA
jgi:hypothetical protein